MKTVRDDRKKSFSRALNDAKNVVADELLFTSDNEFFKNMSTFQQIKILLFVSMSKECVAQKV